MTQKIINNYAERAAETALEKENRQLEKAKKDTEAGKTDLEKGLLRLLIREQTSCCWTDDKLPGRKNDSDQCSRRENI